MGPGIFTKYSKEVLSTLLVIFFIIAGVVTFVECRDDGAGEPCGDLCRAAVL